MVQKHEVYDAFGELIYTLAKADGVVQDEELVKIKQILASHEWSRDIMWSFDYEKRRERTSDMVIGKVLRVFREYGPFEEYPYFMQVAEEVAAAFGGVVEDEQKILDQLKDVLLVELKA